MSAGGSPAANGGAALVPGGEAGSLVHSENGFGSSTVVPGAAGGGDGAPATVPGNSSSAPTRAFVLAAVVLLIGCYAGFAAARFRRPRERADA